ncbi:hypothetical protein [Methylocystis sp.]|nr:hypothetical protein [Methylocystis sp.]
MMIVPAGVKVHLALDYTDTRNLSRNVQSSLLTQRAFSFFNVNWPHV